MLPYYVLLILFLFLVQAPDNSLLLIIYMDTDVIQGLCLVSGPKGFTDGSVFISQGPADCDIFQILHSVTLHLFPKVV